MNWLILEQRRRNCASAEGWEGFAEHRARVMELVARFAQPDGRLAVLGAGNCNDLVLPQLLSLFREVHLIDLDGEALERAAVRQGCHDHAKLVRHGGVDTTDVLVRWAEEAASGIRRPADQMISCLETDPELCGGPWDVIASSCLLTQLIESAVALDAAQGVDPTPLALAVRNQHLRQLANGLVPGGYCVLITDFVSSTTCGELLSISPAELPSGAQRWITSGNFFTGTNPFAIARLLADDGPMGRHVQRDSIHVVPPWLWDLGPRRFAVCAIVFRRRTEDRPDGKTTDRASSG